MSLSLPAAPESAVNLTDVLVELAAALDGDSTVFPAVESAVVLAVDGLGWHNLRARRGHARFLTAHARRPDVAWSVFPSTTAAALTSLLTGAAPSRHGVVGYTVRVPETGRIVNQLKGWDEHALDPLTWQRVTPLLTAAAEAGRPCFVVSKPEFVHTGFTAATLRGAQMHTAATVGERVRIAADLVRRHPGALVYVYTSAVDAAGHKHGWASEEWAQALESVDEAARILADALPSGAGAVVTADHGMVDVPAHRQVLFGGDDGLTDDLAAAGGEPRMLHLYARPGAESRLLNAWRAAEGGRSWVFSREEAVAAGLFGGPVDPTVSARIGDVLVAARAGIAYYDVRAGETRSRRMVGQHGSLTDEERRVPLIRLGALG